MNLFKSTTFTWWQTGLLKWAVLVIGIAVGATWPDVFAPYAVLLVILSLVLSLPPAIAWFKSK